MACSYILFCRYHADLKVKELVFVQAADILLYKATRVPVGEDNLQNLQVLSRWRVLLLGLTILISGGKRFEAKVQSALLPEQIFFPTT